MWKSFNLGLIPDLEALMSIFYSDLVYDVNQNISIQKPKTVEQDMLENAINKL
jgi:hypothetical protein